MTQADQPTNEAVEAFARWADNTSVAELIKGLEEKRNEIGKRKDEFVKQKKHDQAAPLAEMIKEIDEVLSRIRNLSRRLKFIDGE
ncbi:MAG: hypothetical protein WDZ82_02550 [Candidatus Paceibacterota bacterium]